MGRGLGLVWVFLCTAWFAQGLSFADDGVFVAVSIPEDEGDLQIGVLSFVDEDGQDIDTWRFLPRSAVDEEGRTVTAHRNEDGEGVELRIGSEKITTRSRAPISEHGADVTIYDMRFHAMVGLSYDDEKLVIDRGDFLRSQVLALDSNGSGRFNPKDLQLVRWPGRTDREAIAVLPVEDGFAQVEFIGPDHEERDPRQPTGAKFDRLRRPLVDFEEVVGDSSGGRERLRRRRYVWDDDVRFTVLPIQFGVVRIIVDSEGLSERGRVLENEIELRVHPDGETELGISGFGRVWTETELGEEPVERRGQNLLVAGTFVATIANEKKNPELNPWRSYRLNWLPGVGLEWHEHKIVVRENDYRSIGQGISQAVSPELRGKLLLKEFPGRALDCCWIEAAGRLHRVHLYAESPRGGTLVFDPETGAHYLEVKLGDTGIIERIQVATTGLRRGKKIVVFDTRVPTRWDDSGNLVVKTRRIEETDAWFGEETKRIRPLLEPSASVTDGPPGILAGEETRALRWVWNKLSGEFSAEFLELEVDQLKSLFDAVAARVPRIEGLREFESFVVGRREVLIDALSRMNGLDEAETTERHGLLRIAFLAALEMTIAPARYLKGGRGEVASRSRWVADHARAFLALDTAPFYDNPMGNFLLVFRDWGKKEEIQAMVEWLHCEVVVEGPVL